MVVQNIIRLRAHMFVKKLKQITAITEQLLQRLMAVWNIGQTVRQNVRLLIPITVVTGLLLLANMPALLISEIANLSVKVVLQIIVQIERQSVFRAMHIVPLTILTVLLNVPVGHVTPVILNPEVAV